MMHAKGGVTSDDLQAFVDGELDAERRRFVETYLENAPEAAATVADLARRNDMLRVLYGGVTGEAVPARLSPHRIASGRGRAPGGWRTLAASLALVALGAFAGWGATTYGKGAPAPSQALVATAVEAHRLYAEDMVRPVELGAADSPVLQKWLSRRLDRTIHLPDLQAFDLAFVGGRLLPNGEGAAAQLMYEDATGRRVTLYVVPFGADDEGPFLHAKVDRLDAVAWSDETISCAVVGDLPPDRLQGIAKAAYRQLI